MIGKNKEIGRNREMREILFWAKIIDGTCPKGKWIEGDILHDGVTGK